MKKEEKDKKKAAAPELPSVQKGFDEIIDDLVDSKDKWEMIDKKERGWIAATTTLRNLMQSTIAKCKQMRVDLLAHRKSE
jgi:hypothetical protein